MLYADILANIMYLLVILKYKLYFAIIFLMHLPPNLTDDFYSKFHQKDYKIDFQRAEMIDYNKSVFNLVEVKTFKYNRTRPVVNLTLNAKVNMSTELELAVQFYKFLSNEYRKLPGTNFQVNVCKGFETNILGSQMVFKCENLTSCRLVKDTAYKLCNVYPDESRLPPFIPNGEYRFDADLLYNDEIVANFATYLKVYRPVARPKKPKIV